VLPPGKPGKSGNFKVVREKSGETKISQAHLQICMLLGLCLKFRKTWMTGTLPWKLLGDLSMLL